MKLNIYSVLIKWFNHSLCLKTCYNLKTYQFNRKLSNQLNKSKKYTKANNNTYLKPKRLVKNNLLPSWLVRILMPISQFHLRTLYLGETEQTVSYICSGVINNTCQLCSFVKFYLYRCRFVTVTLDIQTSYQPFSVTLISLSSKVLIYKTVLYLCLCKIWVKINVK